eukprot:6205616-Pleurochrysis_carterae.AAC.1
MSSTHANADVCADRVAGARRLRVAIAAASIAPVFPRAIGMMLLTPYLDDTSHSRTTESKAS